MAEARTGVTVARLGTLISKGLARAAPTEIAWDTISGRRRKKAPEQHDGATILPRHVLAA